MKKKKNIKKKNIKSQNNTKKIKMPSWADETKNLVGDYISYQKSSYVVLDGISKAPLIDILPKYSMNAKNNDKVVIELITPKNQKDKNRYFGKIIKVLGNKDEKGIDIEGIVNEYANSYEFTPKHLAQADNVAKPVSKKDCEDRTDFTNDYVFTIDGEDSKDFDDAIGINKLGDKYYLDVHIADVANYIQAGSALDKEAKNRGTSIYLEDRVIPMLPFQISNGICSLNPNELRLTLSVRMVIDKYGNVDDYKIVEGFIISKRRLTYNYVQDILDGKVCSDLEDDELITKISILSELTKILIKKRNENGMISFETKEASIELDMNNKPIRPIIKTRIFSEEIIEQCMLLANEVVATHYFENNIPFIYRIHERPSEEKIIDLNNALEFFGIDYKLDRNVKSKDIQKLLESIKTREDFESLNRLILRSQMQAKYDVDSIGHFGLAIKNYCHFTSPIRRYPDLQIHRIIHDDIRNRLDSKKISEYVNSLDQVALHSSYRERVAVSTQRSVFKYKIIELMSSKIGEKFTGTISGITSWGMYVELDNMCEGLIRLADIKGDYFEFDETYIILVGEKTGKKYVYGDKVNVIIKDINLKARTIDFILDTHGQEDNS